MAKSIKRKREREREKDLIKVKTMRERDTQKSELIEGFFDSILKLLRY
jgi:hypothetical protein